jgi:hypothetical protein
MDHDAQLAIRELLRDLGWLPSDLKCEEKNRLAQEYLDATVTWLQMSEGPSLRMLDRLPQSYKGLLQGALRKNEPLVPAINEARLKAARAQLALQAHIADHNC